MNQYQSIYGGISTLTKGKSNPLYSIRPIRKRTERHYKLYISTSAVVSSCTGLLRVFFFTTLKSEGCLEVNLGKATPLVRYSKMLTPPVVDLLMILWCRISVWGETVWFLKQKDCACRSETWEYNDCGPFTEAIEGKSNWLWLSLQSLWSTEGFTHSDQVVQVNIWQHGRELVTTLIEIFNRMSLHMSRKDRGVQ